MGSGCGDQERTGNENDVDHMTPIEREQWLRDRGVNIETPDDRRKLDSVFSDPSKNERPLSVTEQVKLLYSSSFSDETSRGSVSSKDGVNFVYLPYDKSRSISTLTLPSRLIDALGPAGDILPTYVKSFFADGRSIDDRLFKEQVAKQNLMGSDIGNFASANKGREGDNSNGVEGDLTSKLSSLALTSATESGSVETFPLVRPSSTNQNQGVYIYLDEVGLLKNLPLNPRASQLAQQCGYHPAPNFYGDVFVGRVASHSSSKSYLHNVDLESEEVMDATREWIVRAPAENVAWQQSLNEVTGRNGELQPIQAGTEGVAVQVNSCSGEYSWLQNEEEIELTIPLSGSEGGKVNKSLIKVTFQPQKILVKYQNDILLEVKIYSKIDVDGCTWTIESKSGMASLVVTCEKANQGEIWPRLELSS